MFVQPHGFYVDNDGNVWAADNGIRNGKGASWSSSAPAPSADDARQIPACPATPRALNGASSVVVAPNGTFCRCGMVGTPMTRRPSSTDGKQIGTWGSGKGQGEFDQCTEIAMDSQGRIFVAARGTAASRSSIRTESSLPYGRSSAGRATSPSTRTT